MNLYENQRLNQVLREDKYFLKVTFLRITGILFNEFVFILLTYI